MSLSTSRRWSRNESSETRPSFSNDQQEEAKVIELSGLGSIYSVTFLADGKHIVSSGEAGMIRRWRVEDGKEVGTPMEPKHAVLNIAVSQDGKWIVSGGIYGFVTVWNAESHEKVSEFQGHTATVYAVDVSADGTRIATGSDDKTVCVWLLSSAGERLLGPLQHNRPLAAVKFSPDGRLIATAATLHSVQIHDGQEGHLLLDFSIKVTSSRNQSLAWTSDSKQLFVLSHDRKIYCLDVSTRATLSQWPIHGSNEPAKCISLAGDGTFIAASDTSSVSLWDTKMHRQIGSVITRTTDVVDMDISRSYDLVIGGGETITILGLCDILPSPYFDNMLRQRESHVRARNTVLEERNKSLLAQVERSNNEIKRLEKRLVESQQKADQERSNLMQILRAYEQKHHCETLYAKGCTTDAALSLLEMVNTMSENVRTNKLLADWLVEFTNQCTSKLEIIGDDASKAEKHDEALTAYSTVLSLDPSAPNNVLIKWASMMLIRGSASEALRVAVTFALPKFIVYRVICDVLGQDGRITEAIACFRQMQNELAMDMSIHDERVQWELAFQRRCAKRLEKLADVAMESQNHNEVAEYFSAILSLDTVDRMDILIKRSKVRALMKSWDDALSDANEAIKLDPSSHRGYERRHVALHGAGCHVEAVEAFDSMLLKLDQSPHEHIRELRHQYIDPRPTIRRIVNQTVRHMPRILIDVATGRLYDKKQQAEAFEALPIYNQLVSSMTAELDYAYIWRAVKEFYRYVMLSHTWEHDEPLLQKVENISIYDLEPSSTNIKLRRFCSLVHSLHFRWAWSDTTCVDKTNHVVLQESLVAMFTWYRGSSLTVVYLRSVSSESLLPGGLRRSIWNTRCWTYQEYVAAEIVQFYTEDWKPYLGLDLANHKESPAIISEMQQATGVSAQEMAVLRPGLDRVREKLYLASTRHTTYTEDIAYSLLGVFNVAIPVIYGEGDRAVGRLLEHILTGSGDVTILAWTGHAGSYNSCLPADLTVYNQLVPPHVPRPIETVELDSMVMALRSSLPDLSLAVTLHNELKALPGPFLAASRLRLAGIVCPLTDLILTSRPDPVTNLRVYHVTTYLFGDIEIKTADDLTGMKDLCLVHPWIRTLLDQEFSRRAGTIDRMTQALRFFARLRQPFGALLLEPLSRIEYKRVAADSLIMVQFREQAPLTELIENVDIIEIQ